MRVRIGCCLLVLLAGCAQASRTYSTASGPRFPQPEEIVILPDSGPVVRGRIPPRFPPRREEGGLPPVTVIVAYVVDTRGRVELTTVSFLESPPQDVNDLIPHGFRLSVCDYLRDVRFNPTTVDRQPRRALVIQPFVFTSTGSPPTPDAKRHEATFREMPRVELFEWLAALPACDRRRADSFYR